MRVILSTAYLAILLLAAPTYATPPVSYKVDDSKATERVSIQTVSVDAVAGMDSKAIKTVNVALKTASAAFERESKQCSASAQGHLWGYRLAVEKVLLSKKYLSVVFSKSTVCAGSPNIEKEARVFLLSTGDLVRSKALFKQLFPAAKLTPSVSNNKELIGLDEDMIETMIDDSKVILKTHDSRCDFYLKNISYHIWVDDQNLILFPEFIQPNSFCQKEYLLRISH